MAIESIRIRGARQHNLRNADVDIPRRSLTVITGPSGSGKSSLAFDTIYAEGQRRYVESLSAYARQFLDRLEPPDVDSIEGLSPAISIEQKSSTRSARSTVGTVTEIYDYLRLLFSAIGTPRCPACRRPISRQSPDQIVRNLKLLPHGERIMILAPVVRGRKGEFRSLLLELSRSGYVRARIDGTLRSLDEPIELNRRKNHTIEVVVDRLLLKKGVERRLEASVERAIKLGEGLVQIAVVGGDEQLYSEKMACVDCGISMSTIEPRTFSFNSMYGACTACSGLGVRFDFDPGRILPDESQSVLNGGLTLGEGLTRDVAKHLRKLGRHFGVSLDVPFESLPPEVRHAVFHGLGEKRRKLDGILDVLNRAYTNTAEDKLTEFMATNPCAECGGTRLRAESLAVTIDQKNVAEVAALPITQCLEFFRSLRLNPREEAIGGRVVAEIVERLDFLSSVGLEYLTLSRPANTLSGGESQRIRLATQIGSRLRGVLYVLDEPSIGLHHKDNARLLETLEQLRDLGNTVIVVEHDEDTIRRADYVVDLGPGAGSHGGRIVARGTPRMIAEAPESLTGGYLSGRHSIPTPELRRKASRKAIRVRGASANNLQKVDVSFPIGLMTVVTGVSGSGKSTLVNDILYRALARKLYRSLEEPGAHAEIRGVQHIDKVIRIDQSPIGRTPRSNPATYTGVFTPIRDLYAMMPESRARGYRAGRFSFNVRGGRCETCRGDGLRKIEMSFLPDVYVPCEVCRGKRYNGETLAIRYRGLTISDLLNSTVEEALPVLENIPQVAGRLRTLLEVGLGYIQLGQPATTLSGGEAQRIKLARELGRRATGKTLYILDEPTTGLHFDDVRKLLGVLARLTELGNTVIIIEHQMDVIRSADWIVDLGPDGGDRGGRVVAIGTPEDVACSRESYTGRVLASVLEQDLERTS